MTGTKASQATSAVVAKAIRTSRKLGASEAEQILKGFSELRKAHPDYSDEIDERIVWLGNRSAASKDLAKAGLVSEGEPSAFTREVGEAIDRLAEAEAKQQAEMLKK